MIFKQRIRKIIIGVLVGATSLFPMLLSGPVTVRAAETHIAELILVKGEPQYRPYHIFICAGDSVLVFNNSHSYDSDGEGLIDNIFSYSPNIPEHQKAVLQNWRGVTIYPGSRIYPGYSDRYLIGPFTKVGTAVIHSAFYVKAFFRVTVLDCTKKGVQKKLDRPPTPTTPITFVDALFH